LHIHENGLERLFEVYKTVIVNMGGHLIILSPFSYLFSSVFSVIVFIIFIVCFIFRFAFLTFDFIDSYINEAGTLNTRRLQQVLDQMAIWEREVFEREYADANWYKGKQKKYVEGRDVAEARGRAGLGGSLFCFCN
jgi:5'-3' exonuclease